MREAPKHFDDRMAYARIVRVQRFSHIRDGRRGQSAKNSQRLRAARGIGHSLQRSMNGSTAPRRIPIGDCTEPIHRSRADRRVRIGGSCPLQGFHSLIVSPIREGLDRGQTPIRVR